MLMDLVMGNYFLDIYNIIGMMTTLRFIIAALGGMRAYLNGSIDSDLLDKFVIHPYMEDIPDLDQE